MISIQRLNLDSSWIFSIGGLNLLVDPWLIGSEVDGFSWFNEQWHATDPVAISELPSLDYILISQSYEDHCHIPTLENLGNEHPYIATGKASQRLLKKFPDAQITSLPDWPNAPLNVAGVEILSLHPGRKIDPVYYAVMLAYEGEAIIYASHGFSLTEQQISDIREKYNVKLLITTFTHFKLPSILGGDVNPGKENAFALVEKLSPDYVIGTHDEEKIGKGLISKLAKVTYPDFASMTMPGNSELLVVDDYRLVELN